MSWSRDEGYLTMAVGKQRYVEMAFHLALSIRLKDPLRPICLLFDDRVKIPEGYKTIFSLMILVSDTYGFKELENKLNLFKYSPFQRTLFLDADCLLVKNDIEQIWMLLNDFDYTVQGRKVTDGWWSGHSIKAIIKKCAIPYLVKSNSGVIYFRKTETGRRVAQRIINLFLKHKHDVSWPVRWRGPFNDEPIIGVAMASFNLDPVPSTFGAHSLMLSTIGASQLALDVLGGVVSFMKHGVRVSPTVVHFCDLLPRHIYFREVNALRLHFGFSSTTLSKRFFGLLR